ncbi:MAG: G1 family glutamic endopeptidase [Candidatus Bathyarchaeia archaeon]|jgi:hypothetical protein
MTAKTKWQDGEFPVSEYRSLPPPPNRQHSNKRIAAVLLALLLAISLAIALALAFPYAVSPSSQQLTSSNWSGYCVVSDLNTPQPLATSVSASWTVPTVDVSMGNSYSAAWIGVGGQYDVTLIQVGTEQDSINGKATYLAWYELLPSYVVTVDSISVSPGDKIAASISLTNKTSNTWLIEINDVTEGQSFNKSLVYASSMLSAEWIVEAPALVNRIATLANFGQVTFTDCKATIGGETGTINSFPSIQITLNSHLNITLATVSTFTSENSSFTVSYEAWETIT